MMVFWKSIVAEKDHSSAGASSGIKVSLGKEVYVIPAWQRAQTGPGGPFPSKPRPPL